MSIQDRLQQLADDGFIMLEAIPRITQAFADEGYAPRQERINLYTENGRRTSYPLLRTGQEWYDRFVEEANKIPDDTEISTTHGADGLPTAKQLAIQAAKKAAGLDDKELMRQE